MNEHHNNPNYIHHQKPGISDSIREIVFGMEDGMVSTMGAITGIAVGIGNHFTVVLSGIIIIAVESISMGVGSYLSNKSQHEVKKRMIAEEKEEIEMYPEEEKKEMVGLFVKDGWPEPQAREMAEYTAKNKKLMLTEMAYRELGLVVDDESSAMKNGFFMFISYVFGGTISILPYLIFSDVGPAIPVSVVLTLIGLFLLGAGTTKFSHRTWWKAGLEMFVLASIAGFVGYIVGQTADRFWLQ